MSDNLADVAAALETARAEATAKNGTTVIDPPTPSAPPVANPPVSATPPATTEPPKESPVTTETPVVEGRFKDVSEIWGTEFKSVDDFKKIKEEFDQIPTLKEYKTKYEEISKTPLPKFANDRIKEENNFIIATGLEDASILKDIRRYEGATQKDPIDALVIQAILKNPQLAENKSTLRKSIARDFKIEIRQTDENGEPLTPEALAEEKERVEVEELKLKMRAMDAEKDIQQTMDKFKSYVPQEETQSKQSETKAQWEGELGKYPEVFKTIPVQVSLGKDKEGKELTEDIYTIELTPAEQKGCMDRALSYAITNNLELTPENLNLAINYQMAIMQAINIPNIVSKVRESEGSKIRKELEAQYHNPTPTQNIPIPEATDDGKMTADKLYELQKKHLGG